jgi:mono/diheme cytochrome c family protein
MSTVQLQLFILSPLLLQQYCSTCHVQRAAWRRHMILEQHCISGNSCTLMQSTATKHTVWLHASDVVHAASKSALRCYGCHVPNLGGLKRAGPPAKNST